jgi:predicted DNA-binding protein
MRRKIPTTFTVEFEQLERLGRISERTNLARSSIVRSALEKELRHYETALGLGADGLEVIHVEL